MTTIGGRGSQKTAASIEGGKYRGKRALASIPLSEPAVDRDLPQLRPESCSSAHRATPELLACADNRQNTKRLSISHFAGQMLDS